MEPETRYTIVGALVLLIAAAAVGAALWLSGNGASGDLRFYAIVFERQSLEGLQVGGSVNMRGVKVGRVEQFTIDGENINRVRVRVSVDGRTPVSQNTEAVVARNILTGIARINLETPGTPGPPLRVGADGRSDPVIPEGNSGIERIAESANRLALTSEETLANLNALLAPENRKALSEMLAGIREAARAFQASNASIARVADAVLPATRQGELIARESAATLAQAQSAMRAFERAAASLEQRADTLGRRADDMSDLALLELRATSREMRRTAELLSRAAERLAEPRTALIGPSPAELGPGEGAR